MLENILSVIFAIVLICAVITLTIYTVMDIRNSNKYWKRMSAEVDLFSASLKKEHDLLKRVQAFDEWLGGYCGIMHTNASLDGNEFNNGVANAADDIQEGFLNYLGEYVDGKESSD
jgi:hypothetical protein